MTHEERLRWYIAILLLRHPNQVEPEAPGVVDHRLVLFHAPDGETAYQRALFRGRTLARTWGGEFAGLHDLRALGWIEKDVQGQPSHVLEVDEITDGCEVYQTLARDDGRAWPVTPKHLLTEFWDPSKDPPERFLGGPPAPPGPKLA